MEILEYKIVYSFETIDEVEDDVNELIKKGWQPLGSLLIDPMADSDIYLQTMVKYRKERK